MECCGLLGYPGLFRDIFFYCLLYWFLFLKDWMWMNNFELWWTNKDLRLGPGNSFTGFLLNLGHDFYCWERLFFLNMVITGWSCFLFESCKIGQPQYIWSFHLLNPSCDEWDTKPGPEEVSESMYVIESSLQTGYTITDQVSLPWNSKLRCTSIFAGDFSIKFGFKWGFLSYISVYLRGRHVYLQKSLTESWRRNSFF